MIEFLESSRPSPVNDDDASVRLASDNWTYKRHGGVNTCKALVPSSVSLALSLRLFIGGCPRRVPRRRYRQSPV